jgi:hypothetical protein
MDAYRSHTHLFVHKSVSSTSLSFHSLSLPTPLHTRWSFEVRGWCTRNMVQRTSCGTTYHIAKMERKTLLTLSRKGLNHSVGVHTNAVASVDGIAPMVYCVYRIRKSGDVILLWFSLCMYSTEIYVTIPFGPRIVERVMCMAIVYTERSLDMQIRIRNLHSMHGGKYPLVWYEKQSDRVLTEMYRKMLSVWAASL